MARQLLTRLKVRARVHHGQPIEPPTTRYERRGHCVRCGACCRSECGRVSFVEGMAVCPDYPNRPEGCKNFPGGPPIVYATCGFRFFDEWEGRILGPKEIL